MFAALQKRPVLHAIVWIVAYIVIVNIGDAVGEATGFAFTTAALVIVLAAFLIAYLMRYGQMGEVGLEPVRKNHLHTTLFYLPLVILVMLQFVLGIDAALGFAEIGVFVVLMLGVGLIEEVLFRGLLYRAIEQGSGMRRAVLISGITFGLGHIVNIMRGYDSLELTVQIVAAVAIGIVLALLVAVTGTILPGIIFHICYNIGGSIANVSAGPMTELLVVTVGICVLYGLYLVRQLPHRQVAYT